MEFPTYAGWRIRRAILAAVTAQSRLVRLPKQVVESRRAVARAEARLAAALGRAPADAELAAELGLTAAVVERARQTVPPAVSIDAPAAADGAPLGSLLADPAAADPEHEAAAHEQKRLLDTALARLPERQREVVGRHFGLDGAPEPIAEVAAGLALSAQRTRAIEQDALARLRTSLQTAGLERGAAWKRNRRTGVKRSR